MKTTQYMRQERAITSADKGGIRERWVWGLRLLRDPEAMSSEKSLKHGVTDELIEAAAARSYKLSASEIRYRVQCARTYPTEAQIAKVLGDFDTWSALIAANFPAYEAPTDEPVADHRTDAEKTRDRARALLDLIGEQGVLFPLDDFEPDASTLKELQEYAVEMQELTARFAERDRKRRAYLDALIRAADGDLSMTWKDAHDRLNLSTEAGTEMVDGEMEPPLDPEEWAA